MTFKVIRGQGHGQEMTSVSYRDYSYAIIYSQATDFLFVRRERYNDHW